MKEKTYLTSVRFHLCLKGMWADDNYIERNITSSDVEFLEGNDGEKESNGKKKGKMSKPEKRTSVVDKARRYYVSIPSQVDKGTYFITHTARRAPQVAHIFSPRHPSEKTLASLSLSQGMLNYI